MQGFTFLDSAMTHAAHTKHQSSMQTFHLDYDLVILLKYVISNSEVIDIVKLFPELDGSILYTQLADD